MKHQALARVFAVVLAILCLLMLISGVKGFGKADEELAERRAWEEKFAGRIQNYVELEAELAGSISYEEAQKELEKRLEQHEADASQHRTDTALHTAEKGGNQMGADMIWEAMPEVKGARQELEEGKWQLSQKEKTFENVKQQVSNGIAGCGNAQAALAQANIAGNLRAYLNQNPKPVLPEEPQQPAAPIEVEDPGEFTLTEPDRDDYVTAQPPDEPAEDADEEELAAYRAALEEYRALLAEQEAAYTAAKEEYDARKAAYEFQKQSFESYPERRSRYEQEMAQYEQDMEAYTAAAAQLKTWSEGYAQAFNEIVGPHLGTIASLAADLNAAVGSLAALADGADIGGLGGLDIGSMIPSGDQLIDLPPERVAASLQGILAMISGGFSRISSSYGAIENGFAAARNKIFEAELALKKAEAELQDRLANIWYNLGELEKEAEQLAEEKETLDQEAGALSKKLMENEALKDLTNRRNSARQLLLNVVEVKNASAESGDLPGAAEACLERHREETQALYEGRRRVNLLAVIGAAAGLLGIPGAFELTKKRVLLLAPVLLCLGFAAGADWLHVSLGLGQMYTALFTAIFAAIQFLIVLPKKKTIA